MTTTTRNSEYTPVLMTTSAGEIAAAIIDADAFAAVRPTLNQLQAMRDAGQLPTPAAWLQMCGEMVDGGYARQEVTA